MHHGGQSAVGWVNPVGPNLVGELSVSVWDFSWRRFIPVEDRDWAQELGYDDAQLHPVYNPDGSRGLGGLPTLSPRGYSSWFSAWNSGFGDKGFGLKYSLSGRRGNHYLKFGAEHTRNLDVTFSENLVYGGGQDLYDGYATGQILRNLDGTITGSDVGEPWADFMLGLPNWVVGNNLGLGYSFGRYNQSHYNAFINDDWKVGPNLTLNLGLRWEQPRPPYYEGSPDDRFPTDYQYCAFDFSRASDRIDPVQLMPRDFDIAQWQGPTSLAVPFENLPGRGCYEAKWSYFSPRFGLAWRLFGTNRTVLRLGAVLPPGDSRRLQSSPDGGSTCLRRCHWESTAPATSQSWIGKKATSTRTTCQSSMKFSREQSSRSVMWATRAVTCAESVRSTWPCPKATWCP